RCRACARDKRSQMQRGAVVRGAVQRVAIDEVSLAHARIERRDLREVWLRARLAEPTVVLRDPEWRTAGIELVMRRMARVGRRGGHAFGRGPRGHEAVVAAGGCERKVATVDHALP